MMVRDTLRRGCRDRQVTGSPGTSSEAPGFSVFRRQKGVLRNGTTMGDRTGKSNMPRLDRLTSVTIFALLFMHGATWMPAFAQPARISEDPDERQAERLQLMEEMRAEIESLKIVRVTGSTRQELQPRERPLFRHNSPTRQYDDGSLWTWSTEGRPIVFAKLFLPGGAGSRQWIWSCAATAPIEAFRQGSRVWYPREGGVAFLPLEDSRPPAESEAARMRQMRVLLRRFSGHQFWTPGRSRYELRAIPQPVLRYKDALESVIDGAAFLMAHETEPECVLLLEAVSGSDGTVWRYGAIAIGSAEFHIELDGREFYTRAWASNNLGRPEESYYVLFSPRREL
jgi:hypothetical protein